MLTRGVTQPGPEPAVTAAAMADRADEAVFTSAAVACREPDVILSRLFTAVP